MLCSACKQLQAALCRPSTASCIIVKAVELCIAVLLLMLPCLQMGDKETDHLATTKYRLALGHSKV